MTEHGLSLDSRFTTTITLESKIRFASAVRPHSQHDSLLVCSNLKARPLQRWPNEAFGNDQLVNHDFKPDYDDEEEDRRPLPGIFPLAGKSKIHSHQLEFISMESATRLPAMRLLGKRKDAAITKYIPPCRALEEQMHTLAMLEINRQPSFSIVCKFTSSHVHPCGPYFAKLLAQYTLITSRAHYPCSCFGLSFGPPSRETL